MSLDLSSVSSETSALLAETLLRNRQRKNPNSTMLYVLACEGMMKLGITRNPVARFKEIRKEPGFERAVWVGCDIVESRTEAYEIEQSWHRHLRCRESIRREWHPADRAEDLIRGAIDSFRSAVIMEICP